MLSEAIWYGKWWSSDGKLQSSDCVLWTTEKTAKVVSMSNDMTEATFMNGGSQRCSRNHMGWGRKAMSYDSLSRPDVQPQKGGLRWEGDWEKQHGSFPAVSA